jgi:polyhydroxyalkanoate synthase
MKIETSAVTAPTSSGPRNPIDAAFHAALARSTASMSIAAALMANTDWALHLALSPGKRLELARLALAQAQAYACYARTALLAVPGEAPACVVPPERDRRFVAAEWQQYPYNLLHQGFLLVEQWWAEATREVWGVERHHLDLVSFGMRQWLDMWSPGNLPWTNPVVLKRTLAQSGANLVRGMLLGADDALRLASHAPVAGAEAYIPGKQVAITPGRVVLRNRLMELIQYSPATDDVHAEPVLITPAWIMKYYILDLQPENSLVRYLVERGHTVFCISWKNPDSTDRDLGMDDYLDLGFRAALRAVRSICPERRVHALGYCLGGTLLAIAAAALARDGDDALASLTLLAAQTDFTEPGELGLFIDESQLGLLEAQMAEAGTLAAGQMAGAFQMLRSNDLLWSRLINEYLLGERPAMNALLAWNADATRMPARMHSQYLRRLFLNNELAQGRYTVDGKAVSLMDIHAPVFLVGTATDHVAPWRSVYKLHHLCPAQITFVLTSGGHNVGIVDPPGDQRRHFQCLTRAANARSMAPDDWLASAPDQKDSWWPAWQEWLVRHSGPRVAPPPLGNAQFPAGDPSPGIYVQGK